jgi:lysozyme family protein
MPIDVFAQALAFTLQREGGYVNDPDDPGGETNYGLSKRAYPDLDIRNLTLEQAAQIYRRDYWDAPGFGRLAEVAPWVAIRLFDLGVNCGPVTAGKMLQRAINTILGVDVPARRLNPWREKIARLTGGKPLLVDGKVGPVTIEALRLCPCNGAELAALKGEAYIHYARLNPVFRAGWLERLEA